MTRYAAAMAVVALLAPHCDAQPVPVAPPGPGAATPPAPIVIPITSSKPPSGFYKSGGVLVGADGYYPFDTGHYLLGGFDGLTRYSGSFVMVPPGSFPSRRPRRSRATRGPSWPFPIRATVGDFSIGVRRIRSLGRRL